MEGKKVDFSSLQGKMLDTIERVSMIGGNGDVEQLRFHTECGEVFRMFHHQECCEIVWIEDICGDLEDLIGTRINLAEEREGEFEQDDESGAIQAWTFYEIATIKGSVTIRWCGNSNGFYSVGVSFERVAKETEDGQQI